MRLWRYFLYLICTSFALVALYILFYVVQLASLNSLQSYRPIIISNVINNGIAHPREQVKRSLALDPYEQQRDEINIRRSSGISETVNVINASVVSTTPCPILEKYKSYNLSQEESNHLSKTFCYLLPTCAHKSLVGALYVDLKPAQIDTLHLHEDLNQVNFGGWWGPQDCMETHRTAIVIPFRNRDEHLPILLRQLFPILRRQLLHHRVFVIQQDDNNPFNRGKLMNIGFSEALKIFPYSCFVFHDVDLVPENDQISYGCAHSPMHLSVAVDKFSYRLPYQKLFGGVEMFLTEDYEKVNGFSNLFYSWGGEDDNLSERVTQKGMSIHRPSVRVARYRMLKHPSASQNRTNKGKMLKYSHMSKVQGLSSQDGLNSLKYKVKEVIPKQLFTLIKVDLEKEREDFFRYDPGDVNSDNI